MIETDLHISAESLQSDRVVHGRLTVCEVLPGNLNVVRVKPNQVRAQFFKLQLCLCINDLSHWLLARHAAYLGFVTDSVLQVRFPSLKPPQQFSQCARKRAVGVLFALLRPTSAMQCSATPTHSIFAWRHKLSLELLFVPFHELEVLKPE